MLTVGQRIKAIREQKGLTQKYVQYISFMLIENANIVNSICFNVKSTLFILGRL